MDVFRVKGKEFVIEKSTRKGKQLMVSGPGIRGKVHFGDPTMPEYPGTERGDRYCARSFGIGGLDDVRSANFWSRTYLWKCKGKKSMR